MNCKARRRQPRKNDSRVLATSESARCICIARFFDLKLGLRLSIWLREVIWGVRRANLFSVRCLAERREETAFLVASKLWLHFP